MILRRHSGFPQVPRRGGGFLLACLAIAAAFLAFSTSADAAHEFGPLTSAGPDSFGYAVDGTIPYDWEDIQTTGTKVDFTGQGKNAVLGPFPLPTGFSFSFYGEEKSEYWIATNGFISFTGPPASLDCCLYDEHLPTTARAASDFISTVGAILSYDSDDAGCGSVWVEERSAPRRLVIQFEDVCRQSFSEKSSSQIKLFDTTNHIQVHYDYIDAISGCCRTYVAGIENKDQTDGLAYFTLKTMDGYDDLAVQYTYPNAAPVAMDDGDTDSDGTVDDDAFVLDEETVSVLLDVLANDVDVDQDTLSVVSLPSATDNGYGDLSLEADQQVRFTLDQDLPAVAGLGHGQSLTDTFSYKVNDGLVDSGTATVTVRIDGVDHVPVVYQNTTLEAVEAHPGAVAVALGLTHLDASDLDDPDDTVVFRLASLPEGDLRIDGTTAVVGDTFTRGDVRAGRVTYMPTADDPGAWPQDLFTFTAYDPDSEEELAYADGAAQQLSIKITSWDDPPVPGLAVNQDVLYVGLPARFSDASISGDEPLGPWDWSFGDGGHARGSVVYYSYAQAGEFTVRLDVVEGGQTRSIEQNVQVLAYQPPVADFLVSDVRPVAGEPVDFTDTSLEGVVPLTSRRWDFGGPTLLSDNDPKVTVRFPEAGTYRVTLTVTDEVEQSYTAFHDVMVSPADAGADPSLVLPEAMDLRPRADAGADQVVLPGSLVRLRGAAAPDLPETRYTWSQVGGIVVPLHNEATASPQVEVPWMPHSAEMLFQLVVEQEGVLSAPDIVRLVIDPDGTPSFPPIALPEATFLADVSPTGRVQFHAAPGAKQYLWDFGDGTRSDGAADTVHRYITNGTFRVQLTVVDERGRTEAWSQSVTIGEQDDAIGHAPRAAPSQPVWPWLVLGGTLLGVGSIVLLAWRRPTA